MRLDTAYLKIDNENLNANLKVEKTFIHVVSIPLYSIQNYQYVKGLTKQAIIYDYDSRYVKITGTTSATKAGVYRYYFELKDPTTSVWADGSRDKITVEWRILKGYQHFKFDSGSEFEISDDKPTVTLRYYGVRGKTIKAFLLNSSLATVTVTEDEAYTSEDIERSGTITITSKSNRCGRTELEINIDGTDNYYAAGEGVPFYCDFAVKKTFSEASDYEIDRMIRDYNAGTLDLINDCGWAVGQTRSYHLYSVNRTFYNSSSKQYVSVDKDQGGIDTELAILDTSHLSNYKIVSTGNAPTVCIGFSTILANKDLIHDNDESTDSWKDSLRRFWCNATSSRSLRYRIDFDISNMLKEVTVPYTVTDKDGNITTETSNDYICIPSVDEIIGDNKFDFLKDKDTSVFGTSIWTRDGIYQKYSDDSDNWYLYFTGVEWDGTSKVYKENTNHSNFDYLGILPIWFL